jgi:hypothetical protein
MLREGVNKKVTAKQKAKARFVGSNQSSREKLLV